MYMFGGKVVAQRTADSKSSTLVYLHGDHLGSVGAATGTNGALVSQQEYDPWGKVRAGGVTQTKINYTGQKLDDTGLLFYNARYYDPIVGRFVSPDSIVPGASSGVGCAGGTVGAWQNSRLTVDFHERGFLSSAKRENTLIIQEGFWSDSIEPNGPLSPQALNRYSYTLNNPLRYSDPTGHVTYDKARAREVTRFIRLEAIPELKRILEEAPANSGWLGFAVDLLKTAFGAIGVGIVIDWLKDINDLKGAIQWLEDYSDLLYNFLDDPLADTISITFGAESDASWANGYYMQAILYDAQGKKLPGFHDPKGNLMDEEKARSRRAIPGWVFWRYVGQIGMMNGGRPTNVQ